MYLNKFKEIFAESGLKKKAKPCSKEEIVSLEEKLNLILPIAYKEFLLWGGYNSEDILNFSDSSFEHLLELQKVTPELLKEYRFSQNLPKDAFIFCMHQGYQFMFFIASEGDDPPIYFYEQNQKAKSFEKIYDSFSECLLKSLEFIKKFVEENQDFLEEMNSEEKINDFWEEYPEFSFLLRYYFDFNYISDEKAINDYVKDIPKSRCDKAINEGQLILSLDKFPVEAINHIISIGDDFANEIQFSKWLQDLLKKISSVNNNRTT